jgi:hypothetical protein
MKTVLEFIKTNIKLIGWIILILTVLFLVMSTCSSCKSYNALKLENAEKDITIGQYQEREKNYQYQIKTLNDTLVKSTGRIEILVKENNDLLNSNYNLTKEISKKQDSLSILIPMVKGLPNAFIMILREDVYDVDYDKDKGWVYKF